MPDSTERKQHVSFERLHELMPATDPKGWISLLGIFLLIAFGIVWLFFGKVQTKIDGTGMLINIGGIQTISANVSGRLVKFSIKVGDLIKAGEPIAEIEQTLVHITNAEQKIKEQEVTNEEKEILRRELEEKYDDQIAALNKKLQAQEKLLKSGLVIEKEALETKEKLTDTEKIRESLNIERLNDKFLLNTLKRDLIALQNKHKEDSLIFSPFTGRVFELEQTVGDIITPGTSLMSLELSTENQKLQGIIYVSAFQGKEVKKDMKVFIVPATIKPEEYGSLMGVVSHISDYPTTTRGAMRILRNEEIVKQILGKGSQVEVQVDLIPDLNTVSQYKWTSKEGPPIVIQSGTLCNAKITTKVRKPIAFLIPKIKEILGIEE